MRSDVQKGLSPRTLRQVGSLSRMRFIAILFIALSLGEIALGQRDAASIVGIVEDPSGAVVPGAQITITDADHGTSFVTSTDGSGNYVAGPLKIGRYTVKVGKKDFKTAVIGPFDLQLGQRREVNVKLEIGAALQSVRVNAAPSLETQTSDLGQVIDNRTINDLPLNGRNFSQLALLASGVSPSDIGLLMVWLKQGPPRGAADAEAIDSCGNCE